MGFRENIEQAKEMILKSAPEELWEQGVWDGERARMAKDTRSDLVMTKLDVGVVGETASTIAERIRQDLIGKHGLRAPDAVDARVVHLATVEDLCGDLVEARSVLNLCISHASYKFYKWGQRTDLEELVDLCAEIPNWRLHDFGIEILRMRAVICYALSIRECEAQKKPNMRSFQEWNQCVLALRRMGQTLYDIGEPKEGKE